MSQAGTLPIGSFLLALLERYGVRHVFGIPGVHTAELYRGFASSSLRHVTPRHEQGAGFMADGYARLSGTPGVCFVITGPGLTNIATAMAQAHGDSIPMLVISGVNPPDQHGQGHGNLHELPDQQRLAAGLTAFSHTLRTIEELPAVLARAWAVFDGGRPRPVHIEISLDLMDGWAAVDLLPESVQRARPPAAAAVDLDRAAERLRSALRPVVLVGGGAAGAAPEVKAVAERLGAPVVATVNGRGILPFGHPLSIPASPSLQAVRAMIGDADVVLAVGTEIGRTDYAMYGGSGFDIPGTLIRIDIDPVGIGRNCVPDVALVADAAVALAALAERLGPGEPAAAGSRRAASARDEALAELSPAMRRRVGFLETIRDTLPAAVIVGDSTQAVYAGNLCFEPGAGRGWFSSATGYGTLGYALPAAIGARLAAPDRPVVCLAGDGGLQFTLAELGSAIDAGTPIILLVMNNFGYREIKTYMQERGIAPEGVDLATPDFCMIARAYGWAAERLADAEDLPRLLREAAERPGPTLIEIEEALMLTRDPENSGDPSDRQS